MMDQIKETLQKKWTVTDLSKPMKIVGIEISCTRNSIFIFQKPYIEAILCNKKLMNPNFVLMLMDLHLKLVPNSEENEPN
jgi:hypothetical protein